MKAAQPESSQDKERRSVKPSHDEGNEFRRRFGERGASSSTSLFSGEREPRRPTQLDSEHCFPQLLAHRAPGRLLLGGVSRA